jgi:hypothetical protein
VLTVADTYRIDLHEQRTVRQILLATVSLYRRYPLLFAVLALAVVAPYELAVLGITGYGPLVRLAGRHAGVFWLLFLLRTSLVGPLVAALHMHAVLAVGEGRRPRLGAVASHGLRVLPVVGAADVMASVGIYVGLILIIVPGVILWLRWIVVAQAAAIEHEGPLAAMQRSWRLSAGHYRHIFVIALVLFALSAGLTLGARAIPLGSASGIASVALGIVVETVIASFAALTLAVLYFDLRARPQSPEHAPLRPQQKERRRPERGRREYQHLRDLD